MSLTKESELGRLRHLLKLRQKAARKGGRESFKRYGSVFFSIIAGRGGRMFQLRYGLDALLELSRRGASKGGRRTVDRYGHEYMREIAARGGRKSSRKGIPNESARLQSKGK